MYDLIIERSMEIDLPAASESIERARIFVQNRLKTLGHHGLVDDGMVIVSELATNVLRHVDEARTFRVQLRNNRGRPIIEVMDCSIILPRLITDAFGESGRGLFIVSQLSAAWGSQQTLAGKSVWARLA
jgi:anti-sigma regulatory factor (Ser/Thr protein kinase)